MRNFRAHVRTARGQVCEVRIQANNPNDARNLLEAQYGRGNIVHPPMEVR